MHRFLLGLVLLAACSDPPPPPAPTAPVASGRIHCRGRTCMFVNTSTPGTHPITAILWNLGDGHISMQDTFQHIYPKIDAYRVRLLVTDSTGLTGLADDTVRLVGRTNAKTR